MVQLLVEYGANVNIQDAIGFTCLHCASRHGFDKICKYLIEKGTFRITKLVLKCKQGANVNLEDNRGRTAYYWAQISGHSHITAMLPTVNYDWLGYMQRLPKTNRIFIKMPKKILPKKPKKKGFVTRRPYTR